MRRIFYFFVTIFLLAGPADATPAACESHNMVPLSRRYTRGLLFKVEKCGMKTSYVFGTIHLADDDIARTASAAFLTLSEVETVGFELAEPMEEIAASGRQSMFYPKGEKHALENEIGLVHYNMLLALLASTGLSEEEINAMRPWALSTVLELLGEKRGAPLDEKLHSVADALKKPVFGLETLQEQMHLFTDMPQSIQTEMLLQAIDEHSLIEDLKRKMLQAYRNEDLQMIWKLEEENVTGNADKILNDYMLEHVVNRRNRSMERRMLPHLREHSVLVAVGAMHLMGEQGILHLLEQDGFTITPVGIGR